VMHTAYILGKSCSKCLGIAEGSKNIRCKLGA
jgi:LSD1 subclass zinc finger protein